MYEYRATVLRIIDADTVHTRVDLGCDVRLDMTIRLWGINAPEMNTDAGKAAKAALVERMPVGTVVTLRTVKDRREKYGRYLGVFDLDGLNLNLWLIAADHAVEYLG